MVKKLTGDVFILSANNLFDGAVVYYCNENGWIKDYTKATIFKKQNLDEMIIKISKIDVINPYPIEVDEKGNIKKFREKIRSTGLNLESYKSV